jgi:uncharacterized protein (TIGR02246 family)
MVKKTFVAVAISCLVLASGSPAQAQPLQQSTSSSSQLGHVEGQRAQIEEVLRRYQRALNASDVAGVMQLYTDDAVLLQAGSPTAVGSDAVREAYIGIFQAIDIDLRFTIAEVIVASPEWAFLRSTGSGTVTALADGVQTQAATQELFVLHKDRGRWKLARYSFSSRLPQS